MTAFLILGAAHLSAPALLATPEPTENQPPVPSALLVPPGQEFYFRAFATGVQIYVCKNISTPETPVYAWVFKAPEADLFENPGDELVGIHYVGPTWEYRDGSQVVGARVAGATVEATAIPWLLLRASNHVGKGFFARVTYIQRVNTVGGLAPALPADAAHLGVEVGVPYTAQYYFYKAND